MIDGLSFALTLGCVLAACVVGARTAGRGYRWAAVAPLLALVQVGLMVQAVLDVVGLVGGHRPGEIAVHVAYLACSVLVLPVAAVQVRGDDDTWSAAVVLVALLIVAVLVVRLQTTWRAA